MFAFRASGQRFDIYGLGVFFGGVEGLGFDMGAAGWGRRTVVSCLWGDLVTVFDLREVAEI